MKVIRLVIHSTCILVVSTFLEAGPAGESAVREIIARHASSLSAGFVTESIPAVQGRDVYEVESAGGKIMLRGSSGVAQSSAFYHYLKEFCHAHVSWNGDNPKLPPSLPPVPEKIRVVSPVKHRMAYNYCTHGYTMPFWGKEQWRRELDWLALHGVNMALIIEGQEAVWQNTFTRFGYSKEEVRQWLSSPVHQPWQFMQNMQGVLPPPQSIIDQRADLGKWIVARCNELGIRPILQGYYGMLPSGFGTKHPSARIFPQGGWAGGNKRPDMLDPGDPMFVKIATAFHQEQQKIFGDCEFYAADPFHEGGSSKGMDRGVVYQQVQNAILSFEPRATLVKQCWQTSNKEMFDAGNSERSLALDLWCDCRPFWQKADGYAGTPWGWCFLFNFGGNLALEGSPDRLIKDFGFMLASPARRRMEATAIVPEGTSTNPLMFELMTEMAWRGAPADTRSWISNYLHARYGRKNPAAEAAWDVILETAYSVPPAEGPINSVITAKPSLDKNIKGRAWSPGSRVPYENQDLAVAWTKLLEAAPEIGTVDTYRYDLADVSRQVLVNLSRPIFENAVDAALAKDAAAFQKQSARFLALLADLDELTGTRRDWLMGAWTADARKWGVSPADKAYMDRIARMILTTWVENPQTDLADYANREWNGLLGGYYAGRWKLFFDATGKSLREGKPFDKLAFEKQRGEFETHWISSNTRTMSATPKGDTVSVAKRLHEKYLAILKEYYGERLPLTRDGVIGTWKYRAEGADHLREIRADGSVHAYDIHGHKLDWFNGFKWKIKNHKLVLTRGDKIITLERRSVETLDFTSEGFGEASRAPTPGN